MKTVTRTKKTNVRQHKRNQNGKTVDVSRHTRTTEQKAVVITKAEYAEIFKKIPAKAQARDKAHTKKNAIEYGKKSAEVPLSAKKQMTKKIDWIGVDGKKVQKAKKAKMPKGLKHTQSTRYDDAGYDSKAFRDGSLTRHENDELEGQRHSLKNIGIGW